MQKQQSNTRRMAQLALFIAIIFVMRITGLTRIPIGPLYMTLSMIPIAIGAMLIGPAGGAVLGLVYGCTSLYDAITGASVMTGAFFQISPVHTVLLCVGMRVLMGLCTGAVFRLIKGKPPVRIWKYFAAALCAPLLNTLFFMGYICLFLYQTEMVQNLVEKTGALNPFMFVILLVGVQGLVEAAVCCFIGGAVSKGVSKAVFKE